jgi:hypothetical protein
VRVRTVVLIAAAGALVLGGAGTGTTLALWTKSATVPSSSVTAGAISVTVNGSTSASIAGPTGLARGAGTAAGTAKSVSATLKNDSPSTAKNLRMTIYLDTVTANQADLNTNLEVAASTVTTSGTCPTPAGTFKPVGAGYTSTLLTGTSTLPQASLKLCVDVRVKGGSTAATASKSGTLTFTFRGQQVR